MTSPSTGRTAQVAYVLLVLTMAFWAGNSVVGRWANGNIPPMTLAFLRWLGAAVLILPFTWSSLKADMGVIRANYWILMLLSVLGAGSYNTLLYIALTETTVTSSAILNSWAPIMIAVAGSLIFGDRLAPRQVLGLTVSLLGVLTVVLKGDLETLATLSLNRGDLIILFATAVWAAYTSLLRLRPPMSTGSFAALTYVVAALVNLPLAGYELAAGERMLATPQVFAAIVYTAVFASLAAYFFYARGVEILGATRTGAFIHLIPLLASVMAMIFLGERPALFHIAGFAAILAGVVLVSRAR